MQAFSQSSSYQSPVYLRVHVHGLLDDINQMSIYLANPIEGMDKTYLPLGVMGQIMGFELESESKVLEETMHHLMQVKTTDTWEKAKLSSGIRKKVGMLMSLSTLIVQLPAANSQAQAEAFHMSQRVMDKCEKIDSMLATLVSEALIHA